MRAHTLLAAGTLTGAAVLTIGLAAPALAQAQPRPAPSGPGQVSPMSPGQVSPMSPGAGATGTETMAHTPFTAHLSKSRVVSGRTVRVIASGAFGQGTATSAAFGTVTLKHSSHEPIASGLATVGTSVAPGTYTVKVSAPDEKGKTRTATVRLTVVKSSSTGSSGY